MKKQILTLVFTFLSLHSFAQNETINSEDWTKIIHEFTLFKNNSNTPFQKWHTDMLHFSLLTCANKFNLQLPNILKNYKVSKGGSYRLIKDDECLNFKRNLTSISCNKITAHEKPFTSIPNGFYLYQGIFVHPDAKIPQPNSKINVGIKCKLGVEQNKTEQFYYGEAIIIYDKMYSSRFNTNQGYKDVLQASIMLNFDGLNQNIGPTNLIKLN